MRWKLVPTDSAEAAALARELNFAPPAARVLCARGYSDPECARRFLNPSLADLHDARRLNGMSAAVWRRSSNYQPRPRKKVARKGRISFV